MPERELRPFSIGTFPKSPTGLFKKQNARKGIKTVKLAQIADYLAIAGLKNKMPERALRQLFAPMVCDDGLKFKKQNARKGIKTQQDQNKSLILLCLKNKMPERALRHKQ